ncbi:PREDICTED: protein unc-79 homolog [Nicrophorus vespilloides]|uniref:Protein unc-79 homolog n=1 Tax=Nicrophorus vespilloides TaxID=110193 RepID=A0ABM1MVU6_NICVS|nr:PREDICTED: protein unc-79 homolog [Nicrophorus vespilloides]
MLKIPARFKQCDLSVSLAFDYCDCIVNMGTRAAAFTVKIRNLYDFQLRLMQGVMPPPSGVDIANTIKYFSQTLLSVLKDVPNSPLELLKNPEMDATRMGLYPSLDYKGLYNSLIPLIEVAPLIQYGLHAFGQAILQCFGCLLPFLEHDLIDNLPYLTASSIAVLPSALHQDIVNSLCFYILPFTITRHKEKDYDISNSVSAVIMMVFQYSTNPAHHCQLLECLMTLKQSILKDILSVIAYGNSAARSSAAKLLFYYWPTFNPNLFDRKNLICKIADPAPFVCQRDSCPNAGNAEAAKVCYDHCISITFATDSPPPLYLCIECANEIHREHPNQMFFDILHPMQQVSMVCENKNCRSTDKSAISICFSTECASYNGNHPIRYCEQCHNNRHNNRRGGDHVVHRSLPPTWSMDAEMQTYMVEAVVSLLKEAKGTSTETKENSDNKSPVPSVDNITLEERQLLGRYGVWLLVGRCTPDENTPIEILGRLLAMLFHWFHMTAYSYDGQDESTLEKLKTENVCGWLRDISATHYQLFISCLLPHPPEYARVGGHWDTLASRTSHLKDGLNRLFCLVPYEVITQDIWDYVMPHWMEAVVNDVPEKELPELRIILSKILDTEMSPLGFDAKKMYNFVAQRFEKTSAKVQEQALHWLQTLTMLEIVIPLNLLFSIFGDGVKYMKCGEEVSEKIVKQKPEVITANGFLVATPNNVNSITPVIEDCVDSATTSLSDDEGRFSHQTQFETDAERNLFCCILMLDILLKQMELQDIDKHTGLNSLLCKDVCWLLKCMVTAAWIGGHSCKRESECGYCESSIMWHQLSLQLIKYLSPIYPAHPPDPPLEENQDDGHNRKSPPESDKKDSKSDVVLNMPIPEIHSVGGVLVHMPHVCSIMTATVETVSEQLDLAAIIPAEKVVSAVARAITLSESDVATATVQVAKPQVIGENDEPMESDLGDDMENFWHTSIGKFKFIVEELPQPLQYIYQLLHELPKMEKPDVLYYMLQCLNVLILHGDACTKASKEHRGFFIWCQENLLIKNLWNLCNAEHSHICQESVPLLLHCITLPAGSDVFWRVIQEEFHSTDWRVRFVAVERVTVIARFMDSSPLRNNLSLQAALANAFCYLISSMDDSNVYIAQRATLYLGTIHDSAIKSLIMCLETQFDSVIVDRPMVLQSIYQLHNSLSERKILNWDFFLNRFDTLFLEAQINLEKSGDIVTYLRDLRNTEVNSEAFLRKLHRANEALSQSDGSCLSSVKTLSASFGTKWPYKRTMSAPASILPRHDVKESKEKVYSRQYSAPILKRKSSRFGLDGHMHSLNVVDDQNIIGFLQRVIDLEESDKETMHLLVFLLLQFLSRSDQAFPTEDKQITKTQGIVLRHLYLLLGYSQNDRGLYLPPQRLRTSPAFNVYLSILPQLMDQNHLMGRILLSTSLILLQYAPSPFYIPNSLEFQQPTYSLWALESQSRRNWLMSLVVLLYKYQYIQQPQCMQLSSLIKIVLNSLDAQHHQCKRIPATIAMGVPPSRSRDVSQPSLGTDNEHIERVTTPPLSPMYSGEGQSVQVSVSSKGGKSQVMYTKPSSAASMETHWEEAIQPDKKERIRKTTEFSLDGDETESELIAIPESDLSDSTLHGSVQDEFEETGDECSVLKQDRTVLKMLDTLEIKREKGKSNKRPTWFIGSEEDSVKSWEHKNFTIQDLGKGDSYAKNRSKFSGFVNTAALVAGVPNIQMAKTVTTDSHRQVTCSSIDTHHITKPTPIGKHKKVIEPSITPVCTPVSDCDDCYKNQNQHLLPAPSIERLLPIGSARTPDSPRISSFLPSVDSQLEIPSQERLLPIGQHNKDIAQLVDKVRQALGITIQPNTKLDCKKNDIKEHVQIHQIHSHSPRRLIKQVALESPPNPIDIEDSVFKISNPDNKRKTCGLNSNIISDEHFCVVTSNIEDGLLNARQRMRKIGPFTMGAYAIRDPVKPGSWYSPQASPKLDINELKQSSFRIGEECVNQRCSECGTMIEEYSDEEVGLCIVTLGTFIHREPALAAPLLPDILSIVAKVATNANYPWQSESNIHLPGGAISVAHQFLRCVLHQLAPNGVFIQMFQTHAVTTTRIQFFKSVIQALIDFNELGPVAPLQLLLETLNSKKTLPVESMPIILENMACYLDCLPLEAALGPTSPIWNNVLQQLEILFRKLILLLNTVEDIMPLLRIMITIFKIPVISQYKGILEPFSKVLSYAIQTNVLKYNYLVDVCYLCNRAFTKDRDKLILSRMVVYELVQALKFKTSIPDSNLLMLINLVLQDIGGSIPANVVLQESNPYYFDYGPIFNTSVSECMRLHLGDILEFLTDFHTLAKIKSYCKGVTVGLNEDTIGGIIKCGVAQYLALEITRGNGRDNRAVSRYLPWLYNSSTLQQTPKEFVECISHIRLLSWLLLGSLMHTALHGGGHGHTLSQPIPQEASCQIADHIQVIMAGFAEQPKASVLHMSSLFHTFILCQLWTVYLEQGLSSHLPISEAYNITMNILFHFWDKVTPCILQLVQHSKMLSEIVSLHFLSMLEALIECQSTFVGKLLPLWTPVLCSNQIQLPGHLQVRLQNCRNFVPIIHSEVLPEKSKQYIHNPVLLKWLQRLQFKMGQIELQSSTATQFYSL